MKDYTVVYFNAIERGFSIPSTLCEFEIGGMEFSIKLYGLLIAIGYLLALAVATKLATKKGLDVDALYDAIIFGTVGGILGARAYYVAFNWDYYSLNPSHIMNISEGGLAIYGGIIGALLVGFIVCKIRKFSVLDTFDLAAVGFLIGQGVGRWGNFTNQEAFGTNTDLPWGMMSNKTTEYILRNQDFFAEKGYSMDPYIAVHPTFLYESIWCIIGAVLLCFMFDKWRKFSGQVILSYGIWYGAGRVIIEGFRTDSLYIGETTIRVSQALSAGLVVLCTALLIAGLVKAKNTPKAVPVPVDMAEEEKPIDETKSEEDITEEKGESENEQEKQEG